MRNVVVEQKIVDILWSNWIVQAELCENLCEDVCDLKTCQVTLVASVVLGEERFDGHIDGSGFLGLGICRFGKVHFLDYIFLLYFGNLYHATDGFLSEGLV